MMEYENIIKSCIASKKQVTIEREEVDNEPIAAIPIMISQQLLLIHYLYDFYMDGYKVLCTPKVSISSWNDFFVSMMNENRLIDISLEKVQNGKTFLLKR